MAPPPRTGGRRGGARDVALDGRASVEETFGFIEVAIERELEWLNAPPGLQKSLSLALLALFPIVLFVGLWRRSRRLLAASAGLIIVFYFLMRRVAVES